MIQRYGLADSRSVAVVAMAGRRIVPDAYQARQILLFGLRRGDDERGLRGASARCRVRKDPASGESAGAKDPAAGESPDPKGPGLRAIAGSKGAYAARCTWASGCRSHEVIALWK